MDDYEKVATNLLILFGALIVGGLMILHIVNHDKAGFLCALGAAVVAWFSAFAVLFDKPKVYLGLMVISVICVATSIGFYVR